MTNKQAKDLIDSLRNKSLTQEERNSLKAAIAKLQSSCFDIHNEVNKNLEENQND